MSADVFKTNEIPVVPAEDLEPPPEDQESLLVKHAPQQLPKTFFQRLVTWFGFNGDPQSQSSNLKGKQQNHQQQQQQQQQKQKQNGYTYESPNKLLQSQGQKQQFNGYQYEDPSKLQLPPIQVQPQPQILQPLSGNLINGYTYEPPPIKLQQLVPQMVAPQIIPPQPVGYTYDVPSLKLQQPQALPTQATGYRYEPPSIKLQQLPQAAPTQSTGYRYDVPPVKLQAEPTQQTGYHYPNPNKVQQAEILQAQSGGYHYPKPQKIQRRPETLNDLVSSAASPTIYTAYGSPFSQQQQQVDTFPCNKIPWLPIFPNADELNMLRAKLQAKNPTYPQQLPGYQNIQQIHRPPPEKLLTFPTPTLNAHTYLPPTRNQRPLRQPSIATLNHINSLPAQHLGQPFKISTAATATPVYQQPQKVVLPVETTQHNLVPIPVPNLSITPVPPLYDPKPFSVETFQTNSAQGDSNSIYINGKLVTPTGLSSTSIQTLHVLNQNHPVTQPQRIVRPATDYGTPSVPQNIETLTNEYGAPPSPTSSYGVPSVTASTYGPPAQTYGTPPIKLVSEPAHTTPFSRFTASQPFTARPTKPSFDQTRQGSSNVHQSDLVNMPINVADNAADASESTQPPQDVNTVEVDAPIKQVLRDLNVTTLAHGFQYVVSSTEPSVVVAEPHNERSRKKSNKHHSDRETPLDLLDTRNERVPDFKFMRNTWKPLTPNGFTSSSLATTYSPNTYSQPVTPSPASSGFQANYAQENEAEENQETENNENTRPKTKKIQIIIPYTSKNHPSPFKNKDYQSFESDAGWSQKNSHNDFHDSEESQVVSAATPSPKPVASIKHTNSKYLTKILAKNIRDLLKREHLQNLTTIDLEKLQKNIDGWTEQEFSMAPHRGSTISLLTQPKHIPFEYLTTTQSLQDAYTTESIPPTTEYTTTMYDNDDTEETEEETDEEGETTDEESDLENEIKQLSDGQLEDDIQPDEQEAIQKVSEMEEEDFKRLSYLKSLENNQISGSEHRVVYAQTYVPVKTTTPLPPCSTTTTPAYEPVRTTVLPSPEELWNKLRSLLSPSSDDRKEKVYVVTPQPHPFYDSGSDGSYVHEDENEITNFKSPRFLVRPTPGIATGRSATNSIARLTLQPRGAVLFFFLC